MKIEKKYLHQNQAKLSFMLRKKGFMLWRHHFNGINAKTGITKAFFVEFYLINPSISPTEPVFGQLYEQKIKKHHPSYIMIKAGSWGENGRQIHEFYPTRDLQIDRKKFNVKINSTHMTETNIVGSVSKSKLEVIHHPEYMSDYGSMTWNLSIEKNYPYSPTKYSNWHVQGIQARYAGIVMLDDIEYIVMPEKSFGYADKLWGRDFVNPLVCLSSSNLISDITRRPLNNCCFIIGSGTLHASNSQHMPSFLTVFHYEGIKYEFSPTFFSKKNRVKVNFIEGDDKLHWLVTAENKDFLFDVDVFCAKNETLLMNYESPSGHKYHESLWTGGTGNGHIKLFKKGKKQLELLESARIENGGCQYGEFSMLDFT